MTHVLSRDRISAVSSARFFALVAGPLLVIYLVTGTYTPPYGNDRLTNVLTASSIADAGTPFLDQHRHLLHSDIAAVVPARDGHVAGLTPPGAALWAVPFYWVDRSVAREIVIESDATGPARILHPSLAPATVAAALAVALAVGFLGLTLRKLGRADYALGGAYVVGLATTAWTVAAESLWMHGPAMLWLAIALYAGTSLGSGFAYGAAIVTRPVTAIIAAVSGLVLAGQRRSAAPAVSLGLGAAAGLAALVAYNSAVFGSPSVTGGYTELGPKVGYAENLALFLLSPTRGLLVYAPFLLVLGFGWRVGWRAAPDWVRSAAAGGVAYMLGHLALMIYSGGFGFPAYRYPLEGMVMLTPLLFLAYTEWVADRPLANRAFGYLVAVALTAHAVWAIGFGMRF